MTRQFHQVTLFLLLMRMILLVMPVWCLVAPDVMLVLLSGSHIMNLGLQLLLLIF